MPRAARCVTAGATICRAAVLLQSFIQRPPVELLKAGVPLDRVSVLLGHQSVRVTERHYSPWVSARQEQLEADVRRTWNTDLQILDSGKGTPEVHGNGWPN